MPKSLPRNTRRVPLLIFATILGTSMAAIAVVMILVHSMARQFDESARQSKRDLVQLSLAEELSVLAHTTESHARTREAYFAVARRDHPAVFRQLGTATTRRQTFDFIYIMDRRGAPIFGFVPGGAKSDLSGFPARLADGLVDRLRRARDAAGEFAVVSGLMHLDGRFAHIAVAPIEPAMGLPPNVSPPPIMMTAKWLSQDRVADFASVFGLRDMRLVYGDMSVALPGMEQLPLKGPGGHIAGTLIWRAPAPGSLALAESLPFIAMVCLLFLFGSIVAAVVSGRLTRTIAEERVIARTDQLTNLLNRSGLEAALSKPHRMAALAAGQAAVIYVDLNDLKTLNDTEGHDAGDLALQTLSDWLRASLRADDIAARIGGDEFICVITNRDPRVAAKAVTDRLALAASTPLAIGGDAYILRASIGVALAKPGRYGDWQDLIREADIAMYSAKRRCAAHPVIFDTCLSQAG